MLVQRTILLAAIAALPTWATQIGGTYSDAAAMMAANSTQVFTNISFDPLEGTTSDTFTMGLVEFTGAGVNPLTVVGNPGGSWAAGSVLRRTSGNPGQAINIALDSSVRAFGASFGVVQAFPGATTVTVSYTSDANYSYTLNITSLGTPVFLGFATDSAITNLTVTSDLPFFYLALNNASYGVQGEISTETPEVGTLLLIGSGLLTVRLLHRRRSRQEASHEAKTTTPAPLVEKNPTPAAVVNRTPASVSPLRLSAEPC